jgi:hypothetical protein
LYRDPENFIMSPISGCTSGFESQETPLGHPQIRQAKQRESSLASSRIDQLPMCRFLQTHDLFDWSAFE